MSCAHLDAAPVDAAPRTKLGCQECLERGEENWNVVLTCLECGHMGCDETSPRQHAVLHFEETGHPVVKPFSPPAEWRYCFIDKISD